MNEYAKLWKDNADLKAIIIGERAKSAVKDQKLKEKEIQTDTYRDLSINYVTDIRRLEKKVRHANLEKWGWRILIIGAGATIGYKTLTN